MFLCKYEVLSYFLFKNFNRVQGFRNPLVHLPAPLAQELCRLQHRVYVNEQKLKREEMRARKADE